MSPEQHNRALHIFDDAVVLSEDDRQAYLESACGSDIALRSFVERMLTSEDSSPVSAGRGDLGLGINASHDRLAEPATIPACEQLGRYRILGVLGQGSAGVVYRAEQDHPRREVALKVLHADPRTKEFRWRFENEIRVLARLRRSGIAQIHDAGVFESPGGNQPYIAMELVDGVRLTEFAETHCLGVRERLALLCEICRVVNYAHQRGVIHRDLKPANILVEATLEGPRPRILDFGIARVTDREAHAASQATMQGQLLGTVAYMSPEQVGGDPNEIDIRADVYALGVVGYELLCGTRPIDTDGLSVLGALQAVRDREPRPLSNHGAGFSDDLSRIFAKALAKEKDRRYATPAAFAEDIERFLAHRPILARGPSTIYALRKFVRRNRVVAGVALIGLLAATFGLLRAQQASWRLREQYERTLEVSTFLAGDFAASLEAVAGTAEARREMFERLREHIEVLLIDNPDDSRLLMAHADVLTFLSDIELTEGKFDSAFELRETALETRRRLADEAPQEPEPWADLSIIIVKLGDLYYEHMGDRPTGEQMYRSALEIDERLVREHPESRRYADNLGRTYARMGYATKNSNEYDEAEVFLVKCLRTFEQLYDKDPDNPVTVHGLWEAHSMSKDVAALQFHTEAARAHTRQALKFARRARELDPTNRVYLMACVLSLMRVSSLSVDAGDLETAAPLAAEALEIAEKLCELDPLDAEYRAKLCDALLVQCGIDMAMHSFESAADWADRAAAVMTDLLADSPGNVHCISKLASVELHYGLAAEGLGDHEAARGHFARRIELYRTLAEREDASVEFVIQYAEQLISPLAPNMRDARAASEAARRGVELTGGTNARAWSVLGRSLRDCGEWAGSIEALEQALNLLPEQEVTQREKIQSILEDVRARSRGE